MYTPSHFQVWGILPRPLHPASPFRTRYLWNISLKFAMTRHGTDFAKKRALGRSLRSRLRIGPALGIFCFGRPRPIEVDIFYHGSLGSDMVAKCETLLIAEPGCKLAVDLDPWLADKGYAVKAVDNFKDVLITLQSEKVRVLVMDVCLAEGLGYEAISIIKGLVRNLPIIVTTEENNAERESNIRQKGIFYYHVKSFGMEELMLAISNAMARSS